MIQQKPLILVDGSSYLYRAFHAMPMLTTSGGQPTGAVYGVINMLRKLINDYSPEYLAVIFDAKGKTFRTELFAEYKAHRPPMPDQLRVQIEPLHAIIEAMGLPLLSVEGVEADDVIGTLASQATNSGLDTVISTGDKDMAQLVNSHVSLINTMNNTCIGTAEVIDKFGVSAAQIIDYLALIGDISDNIPGVPKVGPKTAVKWLEQYGTVDNIIRHANEIGGAVGANLQANLDQLSLSRLLATIRCDVNIDMRPNNLHIKLPDVDKLKTLYMQLEFNTWLEELLTLDQQVREMDGKQLPAVQHQANYVTIFTWEELEQWISRLKQAELFAFDTETTSLDYMQAELVGISFAVEPLADKPIIAAYLPMAHDYHGAPPQLSRSKVLERLRPLLEDAGSAKVGQNIKYDMSVLANYDITLRGVAYDTMLESYVLDSTASRHNMDALALKHLGYKTTHFEDIAGKGKQQLSFNQIPIEQASFYAAEDADITLRLHAALGPKLAHKPRQEALLRTIEIPLITVLSRMERNGVLVDADMLVQQSAELAAEIKQIEQRAYSLAQQPFNLGSPKQIQEILFGKLKLPVRKKTPKGQPSTAETVLQELALDYPLPGTILEHRSLSKLKSTYTDRLPQQINPRTGRVHTSYHQAVTSTGRLSSSDPNLQNIPIKSSQGRRIRQAFIAAPGYQIIAADYSQIELRILAHLSQDQGLLRAFAAGEDIHSATAAEVFAIAPDQVNAEQRRSAKAINFGLIYGMSAYGLTRQIGVDRNTAQAYIDRYFARYPGVLTFMDDTRASAHELGYVETVFGRRLYLPEINSGNSQRRQYAERTAINAPMQGTAADIIKLAMIRIDTWLVTNEIDAKMIMQVHDELVFEVAKPILQQVEAEITQHMTQVVSLTVPMVVDVGVGNNWDEAH